jgi:hypothetical protein
MVTRLQHKTAHTIKIEYSDEPVTSFGGLVLAERMAWRLGLWGSLEGHLPKRKGQYSWVDIAKSVIMGLHSGAQGTFAAQGMREDAALLRMLELEGAPEEATVWRSLERLGAFQGEGLLPKVQSLMARRTLEKMERGDLLLEGFVPVFADGTLLEGSARREGSKYIKDKGLGLMWSAVFVGRVLAAQRLAPKGGGEHSDVQGMLSEVHKKVLKPLRLEHAALVLLDSLHGDDSTLSQLEKGRLHYVVGANKLVLTAKTLSERLECEWESRGARPSLGWSESGICSCWIQCEDWKSKRLLVGRRWKREGEMVWNYSGVMTDLREKDLSRMIEKDWSLARCVWRLYDAKAGMETLFSDGLSDLGLHHPPCQEYVRNAGFYALAGLAWVLGTAVDAIGGRAPDRGSMARQDGNPRKRAVASRLRFWRLRRELFALPGRITRHGRELVVRLLGLGAGAQSLFGRYWTNIVRC